MISKIKNNKNLFIYLSIFIFICIWINFLPLVGDDWGWGDSFKNLSHSFIRSISLWKNYNGRILGHVLVFFMSSYPICKSIIMSLTFTSIIYIISKFASTKNTNWIIGILLFIGMPFGIYREVFAWMSGFSNFGIPVLMISIYLYINKDIFEKSNVKKPKDKYNLLNIILGFILGFLMNLFAEHSAIFSVILGIGMIIISYIYQKRIQKLHWAFLMGATLGCTIMFASPSYWGIMAREAGSNMEGLTILGKILYNLKNSTWFYDICINNVLLNAYLSLIFILKIKSQKNNKLYIVSTIILSLITFIVNPLIVYLNLSISTLLQIAILIIMSITIIINYYILYYKNNNNFFWKILSLFILNYIAALPLLAAVGFGPRCFINSYVILCINVALIYKEEINNINKKIKIINILLLIAILSLRLFATGVNYIAYKNREANIKQLEDNILVIERLPLWMYVHQSGIPASPYHEEVFKKHYKIDKDIKIIINQ